MNKNSTLLRLVTLKFVYDSQLPMRLQFVTTLLYFFCYVPFPFTTETISNIFTFFMYLTHSLSHSQAMSFSEWQSSTNESFNSSYQTANISTHPAHLSSDSGMCPFYPSFLILPMICILDISVSSNMLPLVTSLC